MMSALPITLSMGRTPAPKRESSEFPRLSPITNRSARGTVCAEALRLLREVGLVELLRRSRRRTALAPDDVAGQPDHALDEVLVLGLREPEPLNNQWKKPPTTPRSVGAVGWGSANTMMSPRRGSWK